MLVSIYTDGAARGIGPGPILEWIQKANFIERNWGYEKTNE